MFKIDFISIYLIYIIVNVINLFLSIALYFHIKKRFPGTLFIVLSMFANTSGNILVFLRNIVPDWISILIANSLIALSLLFLIKGLELFLNKKGSHLINYILILVFFNVHTYFTYVVPDIHIRHINITVTFFILSAQVAYLMLIRTPTTMRSITSPLGYVFLLVSVVQIIRIAYLIQTIYPRTEAMEALFVLSWLVTVMLCIYSIILMYNKRLINDVNAQEEKFSKAFHAAPFMIMLSKFEDGEIMEVNKKINPIYGYHPSELIGKKTTDLKVWKNENDRSNFFSELIKNGVVTENEYLFRKKSGEIFSGLVSAKIVNINNQDCIISVMNDISIRKNAELKLQKSEQSLRKLNSTKDKFFSIIAHDLRSPFNGILGFSEVLKEQVKHKNYEGIDQYAEIINSSSKLALDLLTNLMEWSMSQTGKMDFSPKYTNMVPMIHETLTLLKPSSDQKHIGIMLDLPPILRIFIDTTMMNVVIRNLISNAIKFTPLHGSIHIFIQEQKDDYIFCISDNGVGISENDIDKLFRIDSSFSTEGTNNESGTGLGLILCKDFINYHKGKIWVESKLNKGSQFFFTIPKYHHKETKIPYPNHKTVYPTDNTTIF